ncbi:MAG: hypothetical protein ACM3MF_03930 [Anaerolineae bacterium]
MRVALDVLGVLFILAGGVWFLQGINVLGGSVMSGRMQWVAIGALVGVVGIGLLVFANRRRT